MSKIIRLHGDPHDEAQRLLPWYVNGTLDADERAAVEAHLAACNDCRDDLRAERALAAHVASIPVDVEQGFAALKERMAARPAMTAEPEPEPVVAPPAPANDTRPFLRRPVALGWAIAAQAAMLALVVGLTTLPSRDPRPVYRTLGSAPQAATGNVLVIFRPDLTERDMRALLAGAKARVVDGPSASNAWVLRVPDAARPGALAFLQGDRRVLLAQPVDAGN